jgi:hypothetical protein
MACGGGRCVGPALESLLDYGLQSNPCLGSKRQTISVLKWPGVESGHDEETDGVCHKLLIHVGVAAKVGHLGAFFYVAK